MLALWLAAVPGAFVAESLESIAAVDLARHDAVRRAALQDNARQLVARTPVQQLDSLLVTGHTVDAWLRDLAGVKPEYEPNDCGEQTGDPSVDAARDLPLCVTAFIDGVVAIAIWVGSESGGLSASPAVYDIVLEFSPATPVRRLSDLAAKLASACPRRH